MGVEERVSFFYNVFVLIIHRLEIFCSYYQELLSCLTLTTHQYGYYFGLIPPLNCDN